MEAVVQITFLVEKTTGIWSLDPAPLNLCTDFDLELTYSNPSLHLINFFGREGNINLT